MQAGLEGPFALCAAFERDVSMLSLTPAVFATEVLTQCSTAEFFATVQQYHDAAQSIPAKASDRFVSVRGWVCLCVRCGTPTCLCALICSRPCKWHPALVFRSGGLRALQCDCGVIGFDVADRAWLTGHGLPG
jgi:hypothetical protein